MPTKEAKRRASRKYYYKHKEDILKKNKEYSKNYYQNNKEKYRDICKKHYYNNINYYKQYYEKNKKVINENYKKYYEKYKSQNLNFIKDSYYYRRLPKELQELIDFEDIKKDRINKAKKVKTTIKTLLNEKNPLIEFIEGKKTILFE